MEQLQIELHRWRQKNFPGVTATEQLLGMMEELGELTHSLVKQERKIRGEYSFHERQMQDAIADLVIYTMGFCSCRGWDFTKIVETTARKVMSRDWVTYPELGYPG